MKHLLMIYALLTAAALAQQPHPEPPKPQADPTQPDEALQKLLMASVQNTASLINVPSVQMRGKIIQSSGQGLVIIEVNKQILALKKGSTLSLSGQYSHLSLQLTELTSENATIEVLPLKQTLRLQ
ncbi:hypothetical protein [Prosthecobacter sp.]|uniref:hypothetical protein n=1 Tax=Prosthecobacter sp. TaxID=1965333 RepID=UPI002488BEE8|nr:hypothetical protein [Prosthecobacter sp.]MDI1312485.1 hypothetical protein [Prosthecobacter sp.]